MKIIICGAGQVGGQIARHLAREAGANRVTVIDRDAGLIRRITDAYDVNGVTGFASPYLARLYIDSDAWTNILSWDGEVKSLTEMRQWYRALPFQVAPERPKTLVIGPGGGSDVLVANVSVFDVNPGREAEVGFWTHPDARGRGVMTEAVRLAARHAFVPGDDGGLGLHRVYAFAAEPNIASRHVLRSAGFTETGRDRHGTRMRDGGYVDTVVHDLLEPEWSGVAHRA